MGHNAAKQKQPYRKDDKQVEEVQSTKQSSKQVAISTHCGALILKYVPKSRARKKSLPLLELQMEMPRIRLSETPLRQAQPPWQECNSCNTQAMAN